MWRVRICPATIIISLYCSTQKFKNLHSCIAACQACSDSPYDCDKDIYGSMKQRVSLGDIHAVQRKSRIGGETSQKTGDTQQPDPRSRIEVIDKYRHDAYEQASGYIYGQGRNSLPDRSQTADLRCVTTQTTDRPTGGYRDTLPE